jgi:hypothetical protein
MGRFRNLNTQVVVSVDDSKDDRFVDGWESADAEPKRSPGRPKKSDA